MPGGLGVVQRRGRDDAMLRMAGRMAKAVRAVSSTWERRDAEPSQDDVAENDPDTGAGMQESGEKRATYDPFVPGRVLFMHRSVVPQREREIHTHLTSMFQS